MQTRCKEKEVSAVRWPSYRGVYVLWCYKELHLLKIGLGAYPPEMCYGPGVLRVQGAELCSAALNCLFALQ